MPTPKYFVCSECRKKTDKKDMKFFYIQILKDSMTRYKVCPLCNIKLKRDSDKTELDQSQMDRDREIWENEERDK